MKISVTETMFRDAFKDANRQDSFSYEAITAIFEYLCEMESGGEEQEMDVICVCCEFTEVANDDEDELKNFENCEPILELLNSKIFAS